MYKSSQQIVLARVVGSLLSLCLAALGCASNRGLAVQHGSAGEGLMQGAAESSAPERAMTSALQYSFLSEVQLTPVLAGRLPQATAIQTIGAVAAIQDAAYLEADRLQLSGAVDSHRLLIAGAGALSVKPGVLSVPRSLLSEEVELGLWTCLTNEAGLVLSDADGWACRWTDPARAGTSVSGAAAGVLLAPFGTIVGPEEAFFLWAEGLAEGPKAERLEGAREQLWLELRRLAVDEEPEARARFRVEENSVYSFSGIRPGDYAVVVFEERSSGAMRMLSSRRVVLNEGAPE